MQEPIEHTEDDRDLFGGRGEGIAVLHLWQDDEGPVHSGAHPGDVRVPEERAALAGHGKVVEVALARLDGALRDVGRPIEPPGPQLTDAMPKSSGKKTIIMNDVLICLACEDRSRESVFR